MALHGLNSLHMRIMLVHIHLIMHDRQTNPITPQFTQGKSHTHNQARPTTTSLTHTSTFLLSSLLALCPSILLLTLSASPTPLFLSSSRSESAATKSLTPLLKIAIHFHHFCVRCWFLFRRQICASRCWTCWSSECAVERPLGGVLWADVDFLCATVPLPAAFDLRCRCFAESIARDVRASSNPHTSTE